MVHEMSSVERIFQRILFYLKILEKKIINVDPKNLVIIVEEVVDNKKLPIQIHLSPPHWVVMRAKLIDGSEIRRIEGSEFIIFRELLRYSYKSAEFKFSLDDEYSIYITEDIHFSALTFDVFDEEYHAIPAAAKLFWEKVFPEIKTLAEESKVIT